jgi:hypothetical protein
MRQYVEHHVNDMDETLLQRCVLCGEIITDYRNIMYRVEDGPPAGFRAGPVYVSPGITTLSEPDVYEHCTDGAKD